MASASARRHADAIEPVDEIRFRELHHVNADTAAKVLQTKPGVPIQQEELDRDMRRIFGTGDFEHVSYSILDEPGRRILDIDAVEKSWGPDYLRLGLGLSTDFQGDANFKLLASYRQTWLNSLGAEWRTDLQVGTTSRISTEFYQPLEPSQTFFLTPSAEALRRSQDVFSGTQRIATYDIRMAAVASALGAQFTKYGVVQLGVVRNTMRATLDTGPLALAPPPESQSYTGIVVQGGVDQLDNLNFTRSGYARELPGARRQRRSSDGSGFGRAIANGTFATSLGEHTFNFGFTAGSRLGANPMPTPLFFQWGGLLRQSGYPTGCTARRRHRLRAAHVLQAAVSMEPARRRLRRRVARDRPRRQTAHPRQRLRHLALGRAPARCRYAARSALSRLRANDTRDRQLLPDSRTSLRRCPRRNGGPRQLTE